MSQSIIGSCPICKEELIVSKLSCPTCGLELINDFELNRFDFLSETQLHFIETFIKCSGNLKETQKILHLSYPKIKKELEQVQLDLGLITRKPDLDHIEVIVNTLPIYQDESEVVQLIKKKLNQANGFCTLPLTRNKTFSIYYEEFGNGIFATNLPKSRMLSWEVFNHAIKMLKEHDGQVLKGQAMKAKLGESALTLDTMEGYIAYHCYGIKIGESTIRTISALSSILEWTGICVNGYGWIQLKNIKENQVIV